MIMKHEYLAEIKEYIRNTDPAVFKSIGLTVEDVLADEGIMESIWISYQKFIEDYDDDSYEAYESAMLENLKVIVKKNGTYIEDPDEHYDAGSVRIVLTCPNCGNSTFVRRGEEDDFMFECLACGDLSHPEDMGSKAMPANE